MTIDKFNFAGKKAIVRVDFNVPLDENGKITDDTRIRGALPTLKKILADGGALIIMSHMGKPKGKVNAKYSLSQVVDAVSEKLGVKVQFAPDCAKASDAAAALKPGEVLLLENLRFYGEEEGKPVGIDKEDPAYDAAKKEMKAKQKDLMKQLHTNHSPKAYCKPYSKSSAVMIPANQHVQNPPIKPEKMLNTTIIGIKLTSAVILGKIK